MAEPIRIRARFMDGVTEVTLLMPHPMETGLRKDERGTFAPAHYITHLHVQADGRTVLQVRMSIAMSQDPLLRFRFRGGRVGERLSAHWTDNQGDTRSDDVLVA